MEKEYGILIEGLPKEQPEGWNAKRFDIKLKIIQITASSRKYGKKLIQNKNLSDAIKELGITAKAKPEGTIWNARIEFNPKTGTALWAVFGPKTKIVEKKFENVFNALKKPFIERIQEKFPSGTKIKLGTLPKKAVKTLRRHGQKVFPTKPLKFSPKRK